MNDTEPTTRTLRTGLKALVKERALIALLLSAGIIIALGMARYDWVERVGVAPEAFWTMKVGWRGEADIVVAGDSRILCAVSPAAMAEVLPGRRILNYAFLGTGCEPTYLSAARSVLSPDSDRPTIVLGVSPRSLTKGATQQKWFAPVYDQHVLKRRLSRHTGDIMYFFRAMTYAELLTTLGAAEGKAGRCFQDFRPDGWEATIIEPAHRGALEEYRTKFDPDQEGPVDQDVIDGLLEIVRRWRADGIAVYGFRPPSCLEMVAMENAISGFDEASFVRQFEAAGGVWVDVDQGAYSSYDGSHLDLNSAPQFSKDLAHLIAPPRDTP